MAGGLASFKPHIAILAAQASYAGMNIMTKVALDNGLSFFVFVAYRQAVASIALAPIAYFLERNERPAMTGAIFWQLFLLAFFGITVSQNIYFVGLQYTSATFASATFNLIPVVTFVMATAFRMEKLYIGSRYGQAKVVGTIVSVGGAMIMTLYNGPVLLTMLHGVSVNTWMLGTLMLFGSCLLTSGWITFLTPVVRKYPAQLSLTAVMVFQGTIQSILVALFFERKASAWRLNWDIELLSIVYTGLLCSGFAFFVQTYCIRVKGPVFVAVFNPTSTILVAILELVILHVNLHLGSLLGGILIIAGLYVVLWGKAKDQYNLDTNAEKSVPENGSNNNMTIRPTEACNIDINQPLLQTEGSGEHLCHEHLCHSRTQISHD